MLDNAAPKKEPPMLIRILCYSALLLGIVANAAAADFSDGVRQLNSGEYSKALEAFKPLANAGHADAQLKLGLMYHFGLGVKEDDAVALDWFRKAADQGNADAQFFLGQMYTFGWGTHKDPDPDLQAVQWYFKAALQGHAEAQFNLGLMFLAGKGVVQSHEEGMKWIQRAARQGHSAAQSFVGAYQ